MPVEKQQHQKNEVSGTIVHVHEGEILLKHEPSGNNDLDFLKESLSLAHGKLDKIISALETDPAIVKSIVDSMSETKFRIDASSQRLADVLNQGYS